MYKELQWHVYDGLSKAAAAAFALIVLFFLGNLFFSAIYHLFGDGEWLDVFFQNHFLRLSFTGLAFAFLAALVAWPFALATAVVLAQDSQHLWAGFAVRFFRFLAYLPSLVYGFVFCWALGPALTTNLKKAWVGFFSTENFITELIAFTVTLVGYPLTIFSSWGEGLTVDIFYVTIKEGIVHLAVDAYSAFVIILSLTFFLVPLFTVALYRIIQRTQNDQYILATRALGATEWESLHITMIHIIRTHFRGVFLFGVAKAFVEGTVKHVYFVAETKGSMSSMQLKEIEQAKISCAKKLFKKLSDQDSSKRVVFDVVDSFQSLKTLVLSA